MDGQRKTARRSRGDNFWLAKISEAQKLYAKEQGFVSSVKKFDEKATVEAFHLGKVIHEVVTQGGYGDKVVENFATDSKISAGTLRDRIYLYRGCVDEVHLRRFPQIGRKYYQALGRIINGFFPEKVNGDGHSTLDIFIHGMLLSPATSPFLPDRESEERGGDVEGLSEAGKLLRHFHKVVKRSDTLSRVLAACDIEWVSGEIGESCSWQFPACTQSWHEQAVERFAGEFYRLIHDIYLIGGADFKIGAKDGASIPSVKLLACKTKHTLVAAEIIHHDDRDRLTRWTMSQTPADSKCHDKVVFGRCESVLKNNSFLKPHTVDLVICDPPYSDEYYKQDESPSTVTHDAEPTTKECGLLVGKVARLLVKNAILKEKFIWFNFFPSDFAHDFVPPVLKAFGKTDIIWQVLTWNKVNGVKVGGHRHFRRDCESILYINGGNRPLASRIGGKDCYLHSTLFTFPVIREKEFEDRHYWKPIELLERLIRLATYDDDGEKGRQQVVLDPFAGSGSTAVAAIRCHRDYRLIESDPDQFDLARANVEDALSKASHT
jgi:16S rRNA G966 N2-methylase RsmD